MAQAVALEVVAQLEGAGVAEAMRMVLVVMRVVVMMSDLGM